MTGVLAGAICGLLPPPRWPPIISLLDYDETSVKIWGPTTTEPTTVEQENGARLSRLWRQASEFGRRSRQRAGV